MYFWKLYLWENGRKSTEYTDYLTAPIFLEDKLDETLDTGEVILKRMPIESRSAFPPKTKFRIERYITENLSDTPKTWDMVVDHDDVEEYEGCPEICTHRIHLIEASVIAQGMHVDNIALTYELQDVTLNYKTVASNTDTIGDVGDKSFRVQHENKSPLVQEYQSMATEEVYNTVSNGGISTRYFINSYRYVWENIDNFKKIKTAYHSGQSNEILFQIPTLMAKAAINGMWEDICEMNTLTKITRYHYRETELLDTCVVEKNCGPNTFDIDSKDERVYKVSDIETTDGNTVTVCFLTGVSAFYSIAGGPLLTNLNDLDEFTDHLNKQSLDISQLNSSADSKEIKIETPILSESQRDAGEWYEYNIKIIAKKGTRTTLPIYYECKCDVAKNQSGNFQNSTFGMYTNSYNENGEWTYANIDSICVEANFKVMDLTTYADGNLFMSSSKKCNCYDMVRKAMLTCDTQIFDNNVVGLDTIEYPIIIPEETANKLKSITMFETIFEQKNLWEVLLQCGYYLHAIPYLEFAKDGTDRFELKYKQLGDTEKKVDSSNKITVFNSRNLSDFFTQYDSYVTNLFSPQNEIDEWGVVKTSDRSYLVSNNTAEIHTKYPIQEITAFDITYNGQTVSALNMIFEETVYSILTPDTDVRPSKANSLYYKLGDNKILGLNYIPPSVSGGDTVHSLKSILSVLFGMNPLREIKFNDIQFHIKYRTQDSLRISQVRPDLQNFMKNSSYENYPHHEQYFGQQDKIIDSERFTANLFGRLIRVGNAVYQRQECAEFNNEKESGDLVEINGEPYYVTACENEGYPDVVLQKVTYSKNFNQLSNIVTIPSEPRFYEISERSQVRREVRLMEFLLLATKQNDAATNPTFINNSKWRDIVKGLIFGEGKIGLPNFAYTRFKGDHQRHSADELKKLFPSSDIDRTSRNAVKPKDSSDHRDVIVPLMHFSLKNAIVFEWDMDDNFKAGDSIDTSISGTGNTLDDSYYSMQPVRYCDVMGRADLFSFKLFNKIDWTIEQARRLPFVENDDFIPTENESDFYLPDNLSIGLDKDNREALSFNYQINLLQENADFITFSNLFGQKNSRLKMCLLNKTASTFNESIRITNDTLILDNVPYQLIDSDNNAIELRITAPNNLEMDSVKSIVLYEEENGSKYACLAKNVNKLSDEEKLQSLWIFSVFS